MSMKLSVTSLVLRRGSSAARSSGPADPAPMAVDPAPVAPVGPVGSQLKAPGTRGPPDRAAARSAAKRERQKARAEGEGSRGKGPGKLSANSSKKSAQGRRRPRPLRRKIASGPVCQGSQPDKAPGQKG
jgi:hypothetical protein